MDAVNNHERPKSELSCISSALEEINMDTLET